MGKFESTEGRKGLNKDLTVSKTPKEYLEFALNVVKDGFTGELGSLHSEGGCEEQLESSYVIGGLTYKHVGNIMMTPDKMILFLVSSTKEIIASISKGVVTVLLELSGTERIGMDTKYPIQGAGRIRRGTEEIVYWCDGKNPDRVLNLSQLDNYKNSSGTFIPNLSLFIPAFNIATCEMLSENSSGGLIALGTYRLSLYYVDKNGANSEVFYVSNQIQVARGDTVSGEDYLISGAHNKDSENNSDLTYAFVSVNKSFTFKFDNLDNQFEKLAIVITKYDDSTGATTGTYLLDELLISDNSFLTYDFKGVTGADVEIDYATLSASYARYVSSKYMIHIQNRLIKANVTEDIYDWAKVQRLAMDAKVKWVASPMEHNKDTYKQAKNVYNNRSLMRDEVASIGFTLIMRDGQESPVIHLPGRPEIDASNPYVVNGVTYTNTTGNGTGSRGNVTASDSWDKNIITASNTTKTDTNTPFRGLKHLGANVGSTYERWKVWNTAVADTAGNTESDYVGSGIMGYHESDTVSYPLVRDSEGEIIYPHTNSGGTITMHKIRHHRVPNTELAPLGDLTTRSFAGTYPSTISGNEMYYRLGIKIYDLVIPSEIEPFVAGIKMYMGDRFNNKTIREKGYGLSHFITEQTRPNPLTSDEWFVPRFPAFPASEGSIEQQFPVYGDYCKGIAYISHNALQGVGQFNSEYMHQEAVVNTNTLNTYDEINISAGQNLYRHQFYTTPTQFTTSADAHHLNNPIDTYATAPYAASVNKQFYGVTSTIRDVGYSQANFTIALQDGIQATPYTGTDSSAANGRFWRAPLADGINYSGSYNTKMLYVSLKDNKDVYNDLEAIQYVPCNDLLINVASTYEAPGTHCYIGSLYHFSGWYYYLLAAGLNNENYHTGMYRLFVESEANVDMRGEGTDDRDDFYPNTNDLTYFLRSHYGETYTYHKDDKALRDMTYRYNPDYSIIKHPTPRLGLDNDTIWQNADRGKFPSRIIWSAKSQDEDVIDANLEFAVLDYDDLSLDKGGINMLAQKPNMLFAMTDYSVFGKPTNAQGAALTDSTLFLKNSNFLDIPETELYETGSGYGGCQSRFASINTEYGTAYVNQMAGEVYLLNKQIKNISAQGMGRDMRDRLPSKLLYEFKKVVGKEYPYKDSITFESMGVGTRLHFDPIQKRLIMSKIDYEFILPLRLWDNVTTQDTNFIYWDDVNSTFMWDGSNVNPKDDSTRFRVRNLTISYDFVENKWLSYHSWIPKVGFNDTNNLYTMPSGGTTWFKHVEHSYLKYYNTDREDMIIEFVTPNIERSTTHQFNWLTRCRLWNTQHHSYLEKKDTTFNSAIVYNDRNTSGLLNLVNQQNTPFGWTSLANNEKAITRYNNIWRLNNIWDMRSASSGDQPPMTEDWGDVTFSAKFLNGLNQGYVDKVANSLSYDLSKSKFDTSHIDNLNTKVRLIYNTNVSDEKLTVDLLSLYKQNDLI